MAPTSEVAKPVANSTRWAIERLDIPKRTWETIPVRTTVIDGNKERAVTLDDVRADIGRLNRECGVDGSGQKLPKAARQLAFRLKILQ